jgi:hypothetical protein
VEASVNTLRCAHCGDVIGIYEPTTVIEHGRIRETSAAAEPALAAHVGLAFHRDCYAEQAAAQTAAAG